MQKLAEVCIARPVFATMLILLMVASVLQYFYLGAQYNIAQAVVSLRVRATAIAISGRSRPRRRMARNSPARKSGARCSRPFPPPG